jgi:hypothetical protein
MWIILHPAANQRMYLRTTPGCGASNGGVWQTKKLELFENVIFWCNLLTLFLRSCQFLRTEIDSSPSNFTGNMMQCISIDWYPETSTLMLDAAVNATRSPKKRPIGLVSNTASHPKKIRLSWYQSIDKKHFWVYAKFENGLSIPFTRKVSSKKVRLFPRSVLSIKNRGLKSKIWTVWKCFWRVAYFSEPRWTTHS